MHDSYFLILQKILFYPDYMIKIILNGSSFKNLCFKDELKFNKMVNKIIKAKKIYLKLFLNKKTIIKKANKNVIMEDLSPDR